MRTNTRSSISDLDKAEMIMLEISRTVVSRSQEAASRGEKYDLTAIFEEAITDLSLTQEQLINVWALFMLGSQVVRRAHRESIQAL